MYHTRTIPRRQLEPQSTVGLGGMFLIALVVSACNGDPSQNYKITIEHQQIDLNEQHTEDSVDYSSAVVSIKRVDKNESNEEVLRELKESTFRHGKVELRGQIEQPIWVEVVVESDTATEELSARTYIEPGESVSLAVIDTDSTFYDAIGHVGTMTNVQDPSKKFSLTADLNSLNFDIRHGFAFLESKFWDERGAERWEMHSFIVLQDGKLSIEMEVEEPLVVWAYVSCDPSYFSAVRFIAEPGATIHLEPSRNTAHVSETLTSGWFQNRLNGAEPSQGQELEVNATSARHARFFESWQRSFTYRLKQAQLDDARAEDQIRSRELDAMRSSLEETDDGQSPNSPSRREGASWVKIDPAEGCEHIDLSQVLPDISAQRRHASLRERELWDELTSIRHEIWNDIARRARDPFDSLLALELGAFSSTQQRGERIKILDELSQRASQSLVEKRVVPLRNYTLNLIASEESEHRTMPGQKAPDFELFDLRGDSQRFGQILKENDLVFLDFFRNSDIYSAAESITATLHNEYGDAGLQIVEVLFDVDSDRQQKLAANQAGSWIQLVDPNIYSYSEVAKTYAVVHRYLDYLIDSNGCIVQRNIGMDALRGFLDSYFDIPSSTD